MGRDSGEELSKFNLSAQLLFVIVLTENYEKGFSKEKKKSNYAIKLMLLNKTVIVWIMYFANHSLL